MPQFVPTGYHHGGIVSVDTARLGGYNSFGGGWWGLE